MNRKIIIGIIVVILIIAVGVGIYFISTNKTNETNQQVSDTHQHIFTEVTCESPKTCTICGKTEGDTLSHTTNIGRCATCGQLQNEELAKMITDNIMTINENTTNCSTKVQSANLNSPIDCFSKFSSASTNIKSNNTYLEKVIELCGEYEELSNIKENCNKLLSAEINISASDTNSLTEFLKDFQSYLLTTQSLYENVSELAKLYI